MPMTSNACRTMRLPPLLLILVTAGCSTFGVGKSCQPEANCPCNEECQGATECEPCQDCESCGHSGLNAWLCRHGWFCHGRHPHYHRIPDNIVTKSQARCQAQKDLRKYDHDQCVSCDYRLGYEQAYVDVAMGSCGDVPALPPANYWKACDRTPQGHRKAQQWFSGYAAGAARAKAFYEPYNEVAHSPTDANVWDKSIPEGMQPRQQY
ncbi:hypothetical protein SH661x_001048 [Planctomicrobium sp. SH661]|uniref:hypothetical protein n=1 Tax=Planctomicrobium sp. SH661 TaxID=3448124 RepID=UPI003F5AEEED